MNTALRYQRADGAAALSINCDASGTSRLCDLYQRAPCRILFPEVEAGEPLQAVLLTTTGGLTGGDRTRVEFKVGAKARATLTTQAAEKLYRALPGAAPVECALSLQAGPDSWAEWLAQESILFNGAQLRRSFSADLAPGARMLALESIVLGRQAMGEDLRVGMLHDSWRIRLGGRLIWADAMRLEGDITALRRAPFSLGEARACATLLYVGPDSDEFLEPVHCALANAVEGCGATLLDGLLIVRLFDVDPPRLRARALCIAGLIRHRAAGISATLPRVWHC